VEPTHVRLSYIGGTANGEPVAQLVPPLNSSQRWITQEESISRMRDARLILAGVMI